MTGRHVQTACTRFAVASLIEVHVLHSQEWLQSKLVEIECRSRFRVMSPLVAIAVTSRRFLDRPETDRTGHVETIVAESINVRQIQQVFTIHLVESCLVRIDLRGRTILPIADRCAGVSAEYADHQVFAKPAFDAEQCATESIVGASGTSIPRNAPAKPIALCPTGPGLPVAVGTRRSGCGWCAARLTQKQIGCHSFVTQH